LCQGNRRGRASTKLGWHLSLHATAFSWIPVPTSGAVTDDTMENSVCFKHPAVMAECPSMECQSIDRVFLGCHCVVLALRPTAGNVMHGLVLARVWPPSAAVFPSLQHMGFLPDPLLRVCGPRAVGWRSVPTPAIVWHVSSGDDGTIQGERYSSARGEILRPLLGPPQRRRSAGLCSSIKDESLGSQDDQIPS